MQVILEEIRDEMETAFTTTFKKYYTGRVHEVPVNYLPVLMVYGDATAIEGMSTVKDKYSHTVTIEILTSAFLKVKTTEDADEIQQAQKQIYDLMEEKDASGVPLSTSIIGVLRRNILGSKYSFHNDYEIAYESEKVDNRMYYRGRLTIPAIVSFNARS